MADKKIVDALSAGVLGAAIGVAATKIMSDPEMKSKAVEAFHRVKKYALDGVSEMKKNTQELQSTSQEAMTETKNKLGKAASQSLKTV